MRAVSGSNVMDAVVHRLAAEGAKLHLVSRTAEALRALEAELQVLYPSAPPAQSYAVDLSRTAEVGDLTLSNMCGFYGGV